MDEHPPDLNAAQRALVAQFRVVFEAAIAGWRQFAASPAGAQLLTLAAYFQEHPEELNELIAAREAEALATQHTCHCLCGRWDHLGQCTGKATTQRSFGPVQVPLCEPCAGSIDAHRAPSPDV